MEVFCHHIYEYKKGLRSLVLHTTNKKHEDEMIKRLESYKISYLIHPVNDKVINVFFGDDNCIQILKTIGKESLREYTAEEDFILGTMLGYDRLLQCKRYIQKKNADLKLEINLV